MSGTVPLSAVHHILSNEAFSACLMANLFLPIKAMGFFTAPPFPFFLLATLLFWYCVYAMDFRASPSPSLSRICLHVFKYSSW